MSAPQLAAAALCASVALAHSWLGERYVLIRLFRRADLPHLFGSDLFTRRTLRFAWHLTSVAWLGFGALLVVAARGAEPGGTEGLRVVAATFAASALVTLVGSRGRHLAWVLFAAIAALAWLGAGDVLSSARARLVPRPALDLQAGKDSLSAFFVLGFLDEYRGRRIVEGSDLVEWFFCSEAAAADTLAVALVRLAADQHLEPRLERKLSQAGEACRIQFRSPALSAGINSLYAYRFDSGIQRQGEDGRYHRTAAPRVTERMIRPYGREAQLAFLSGAFARRSRDGDYLLVNAEHKAELIGQLLADLGCSDVWVRSTAGLIPRTTLVSFVPTAEVTQWLEHYRPAPAVEVIAAGGPPSSEPRDESLP